MIHNDYQLRDFTLDDVQPASQAFTRCAEDIMPLLPAYPSLPFQDQHDHLSCLNSLRVALANFGRMNFNYLAAR